MKKTNIQLEDLRLRCCLAFPSSDIVAFQIVKTKWVCLAKKIWSMLKIILFYTKISFQGGKMG